MPDNTSPEAETPAEPPVEPAVDADVVEPTPEPSPDTTPPAQPADTGYTAGGVPTFDSVREKIESRYGTAIGAAELDAESPEGRTVEEQYDARQKAAAERLKQIRDAMRDDPQ